MRRASGELDTTMVFNMPSQLSDEQCLVSVLQGLANRTGPRLYLGDIEDHWLQIYAERNGLKYEVLSSLLEVLHKFGEVADGLVLYDPDVSGSRYVAITLCGIEDLLPISYDLLKRYSDVFSQLGLQVRHDFRGRFATSVEAYEWALENLMPRCNRRLALSVDGVVDGVVAGPCGPWTAFDWTAMNRGFVFALACSATEQDSYGRIAGGSPEQAAMYERIMASLESPAQITGFGEPEGHWVSLFSKYGHYSFHWGTNWSFHSKVPATKQPRQKKHYTPACVKAHPDKHYVVLMPSEGDMMKGPLTFYFGSWFDPCRGTLPLNWGINPLMAKQFPAMLEYYYDTATENDCFFAGTSGAGYAYINDMSLHDVEVFAQQTAEAIKLADIDVIDVWEVGPDDLGVYAAITDPLGMVVKVRKPIGECPNGIPVAEHELWYWQAQFLGWQAPWRRIFDDPSRRKDLIDKLVHRIESIACEQGTPSIIPVYTDMHNIDYLPRLHREIAEALDPERFLVTRLDEAFAAMRVWMAGRQLLS